MISKGEVPDKQLQISSEQYISLNAHLLDELPVFLSLASTYFDIIVSEFARVQATYWRKCKLEWKSLTIEQPFGKEHSWSSIETEYNATIKRIQPRIDEIGSKPRDSACFVQPNSNTTTITSIDQGKLDWIYSLHLLTSSLQLHQHPQHQNTNRIRNMIVYLVNHNPSLNASHLSIMNHPRNYKYKKVT